MTAGRPTTYDEKYPEMLLEHLSKGYSFESFGGVVGCAKETLYNWLKANKKFLDAKKAGETANMLFWERLGTGGAAGKIEKFNTAAWIFNMKNRHGWRDRVELSGDQYQPIQLAYMSNKKERILDHDPDELAEEERKKIKSKDEGA